MPTAAQVDLLATIIIVTFPARIQTVGEAVNYVLQRSGYRLAPLLARAPEAEGLLALKLPAVHRNLGPVTLGQALETLAGKPFHLVRDPVRRLISFELHPSATYTGLTIDNHKLKGPHYGE
jgi:type IV pili sensor histidine kinase/response regulator